MDAGDYYQESRTNLIINYLPQSLGDGEFKSLFLSIGPIKSCKIVRNKATGYSYGFGFVDYETSDDAARAISTLNGFQLQNKRIKVAFARPSSDQIKNANLYIKGIPASMSHNDLESIFSECGSVIQCRVIGDSSGQNKGIGFVLYDLREQAEAAIKQFSGQILPGGTEPLTIKFAEDNSKKLQQAIASQYTVPFRGGYSMGPLRQGNVQNRNRYNPLSGQLPPFSGGELPYNSSITVGNPGHTLFVYNIGSETDENALWQLFAPYGALQKVNVIRDQNSGQSKGYGFVTMANIDDAVWAVESLNGFKFCGRPLQVSFKTPK